MSRTMLTLSSELRTRIELANDAMPKFVKTDPERLLDDLQRSVVRTIPGCNVEWQPIDVMYLIAVHCGMRHTEFLLERALVLREQLDSRRLVPSARNLLRLVLQIAVMKDYCSDFQQDLIGLVCSHFLNYVGSVLIVVKACFLRHTQRWCSFIGNAKGGTTSSYYFRSSSAVGDDTAVEYSHCCVGSSRTCRRQPCNLCAGESSTAAYARANIGASPEACCRHPC